MGITNEEKGYIFGSILTIVGTIVTIMFNPYLAILVGIGIMILWWTMEVNE